MQMEVKVDIQGFKDLMVALNHMPSTLPRHLRTVVNKTVKTIRKEVIRDLGKVMHLKSSYDPDFKKAQTLKKVIVGRKMANEADPTAIIYLNPGYPFNLKWYEARPYVKKKKGKKVYLGVTYRVQPSKMAKNRNVEHDAFMSPKNNHYVYRRVGKERTPWRGVVGPKPGDYYQQIGAKETAVRIARDRLPKEIKRRVREILLEKQGIIKLKASR